MFSAQVGTDFKISFLKRSLNFCYDQQNGTIHAVDLETFEKLGVNKDLVYDCVAEDIKNDDKVIDTDKEQKENALQVQVDAFEQQVCVDLEDLQESLIIQKKKNSSLQQSFKEVVEYQQELIELIEDKEEQQTKIITGQQETINILKNSISILNKKIKESTETTNKKFEAVLELLSEKALEKNEKVKQWPEVLRKNITLDKIWNSMDNKSEAAILSIMFMLKKAIEEKGTRIS